LSDQHEERIRVVVIDDNLLALMGVRIGLRAFPEIEIIGEAVTGSEGLELIAKESPDVALIDLILPDMSGSAVAAVSRRVSPLTRNIIFTGELNASLTSPGLPESIDGYFHKTGEMASLASLIRRDGRQDEVSDADASPAGRGQQLGLREQEMLLHLANGKTLKGAARQMQISFKAADRLKQSLMQKLDIHDRVELLLFAIQVGVSECPFWPLADLDRANR
jgi:NarL family two-component system response regulator LiaR